MKKIECVCNSRLWKYVEVCVLSQMFTSELMGCNPMAYKNLPKLSTLYVGYQCPCCESLGGFTDQY